MAAHNKVVLSFILIASPLVQAEDFFTYKNEREIMGGAASLPPTNRGILEKTVSYCEDLSPEIQEISNKTVADWMERNAKYLEAADVLIKKIKEEIVKSDGEEAWDKTNNGIFKPQLELTSSILVNQLNATDNKEFKISMCKEFIANVNAGRLDVDKADSVLVGYLDNLIQQQHK